jgi:alpha-tubulin suppressor-like RCC1 family protein
LWKPKKLGKIIFGPNSAKIYAQHISASDNYTLVSVGNKLYSFGKEDHGRLGLDQANIDYTEKAYLISLSNIKVCGITVGKNHCLCWDASGAIYSWGSNENGKAGHPIVQNSQSIVILSPLRVHYYYIL